MMILFNTKLVTPAGFIPGRGTSHRALRAARLSAQLLARRFLAAGLDPAEARRQIMDSLRRQTWATGDPHTAERVMAEYQRALDREFAGDGECNGR